MSDEHIKVLREMQRTLPPSNFTENCAALDAAIAALGGVKEVGEVTVQGVVGVRFNEGCNYGCNLAPGTRLYALPAPPSKEG